MILGHELRLYSKKARIAESRRADWDSDTIDLQTQEAPSAKDHTRQPNRPGAIGEGPPAPHQADALKHVELEINEQHGRSPRASQDLSGKELGLLHHEEGDSYGGTDGIGQDSVNATRNAGMAGAARADQEQDLGDVDGDESDDDLMDKISSSPSIGDDGGYHLPLPPPKRRTPVRCNTPPLRSFPNPMSSRPITSDVLSSSPFTETPTHFPISLIRNEQDSAPSKDHHQKGRYSGNHGAHPAITVDEFEMGERRRTSSGNAHRKDDNTTYDIEDVDEAYNESFDSNDFHHLLLPTDDPLLDNSFDEDTISPGNSSPTSKTSWNEDIEQQRNDDDTEEISFVDDSRFIDSGWGGECLREIEDIDFEFVYALHTFVATVEGQANATKGDTMVLLDDSNSYWWLVRVVKDSSIGECKPYK